MHRLDASDERRVGRFVVETAVIESDDEPFPAAFLAALRRLVPCDDVVFRELDGAAERAPSGSLDTVRDAYPVDRRHELTGAYSAHRPTDVVTPPLLRRNGVGAQWFRPQHAEDRLTVGLGASRPHTQVFVLSRTGGRDFTERDCAVLDALRPYLGARYTLWAARHGADVEPLAAGPDPLTAREREIVALVRAGLTNAEIAVRLSVAPGTVRRHLENVYGKLGVHTRTAALAKLRIA
jgi:DNA-binding CsgD family transcriptional regulator